MEFRIVYRSAILHRGKWLPKIAYLTDGKPAILEGDPDCPYNTRQEALDAVPELEACLMDQLTEAEGPPPVQK